MGAIIPQVPCERSLSISAATRYSENEALESEEIGARAVCLTAFQDYSLTIDVPQSITPITVIILNG